jgi:hypothetical protein
MSAHRVEVDESIFVDVGDQQSELVHMACEHQHRVSFRIQRGNPIAHRITGIRVSDRLHMMVEHFLRLRLVARRRAGVKKFTEKRRDLVVRHGFILAPAAIGAKRFSE